MNLQFVADGVLTGAMIGLGAIGVTLTYSILRFANFAQGEFIAWGAYFALLVATALGWLAGGSSTPIGPFSRSAHPIHAKGWPPGLSLIHMNPR